MGPQLDVWREDVHSNLSLYRTIRLQPVMGSLAVAETEDDEAIKHVPINVARASGSACRSIHPQLGHPALSTQSLVLILLRRQ